MITAGSQHLKKVELGEGEQFAAGAHCSARGKGNDNIAQLFYSLPSSVLNSYEIFTNG